MSDENKIITCVFCLEEIGFNILSDALPAVCMKCHNFVNKNLRNEHE